MARILNKATGDAINSSDDSDDEENVKAGKGKGDPIKNQRPDSSIVGNKDKEDADERPERMKLGKETMREFEEMDDQE